MQNASFVVKQNFSILFKAAEEKLLELTMIIF